MASPLLILGIQATLRAARAGAALYGEHARDRFVFLPNLELPEGARGEQLISYLKANPSIAETDPQLSSIWNKEKQLLSSDDPELIDAAYAVMLQHKAKDQLVNDGKDQKAAADEAQVLAAGRMVEQWRKERQPPSSLARMALTLTDIGLEFIASDPSLIGVGARGEKLIVSFAGNMSALIPDSMDAFGAKADFADRVLGIFLRAGLGALTNNASLAFGDEDIAKLLQGVTKPIIDALPLSIEDQISYRGLVDALAGPSAEAVFKLLAENSETYFGSCFSDDKVLGAVTSALFEEIKTTAHGGSVMQVFREEGAIRLFQAGLKVAMKRPGLFVGDDGSADSKIFQELLRGAAGTLSKYPRFNGPIGASLAAMAVEVIGDNAPALLKPALSDPWGKVVITTLGQVATGLSQAFTLNPDGSLKGAFSAFTDAQLLELGREVLRQVARTPGMLGVTQSELQSVLSGMAEVIAADENLLLSADEWIRIAGIAAQKAASNPGRLFGLSAGGMGSGLAVRVITSVLEVAQDKWTSDGRSVGALFFGDTLRATTEKLINALSGNVTALTANPAIVGQFLNMLLMKASAEPAKLGSEGLLKVLDASIGAVLAKGNFPDEQEIKSILSV